MTDQVPEPEVKRLDIASLPEKFVILGLTPARWISYLPERKQADGLTACLLYQLPDSAASGAAAVLLGSGIRNSMWVDTLGLDPIYLAGFMVGWDNGCPHFDDQRIDASIPVKTQLSNEYRLGRQDGAAAALLCGLPDPWGDQPPVPPRRKPGGPKSGNAKEEA